MKIKLSEFLKTHKVSELYMKEASFTKVWDKKKPSVHEIIDPNYDDNESSFLYKMVRFKDFVSSGKVISKICKYKGLLFHCTSNQYKAVHLLEVSIGFKKTVLVPYFACWVDIKSNSYGGV